MLDVEKRCLEGAGLLIVPTLEVFFSYTASGG